MSGSDDPAETGDTFTQATLDSGAAPAGRLIGRYRVIRELGRGGMGEVYLAARADDEYRKHVALKLIRAGDETREDLLRHFRRERQILAALDHPNIAKLLDGGTTEAGQPYFVMDYIKGVPVDDYCDRRRLPVTGRLELFESICAAVAYAHRNLVIHRDIKPTNILVTGDGVPKLLDFGLAKLVNPDLGMETATGTRFAFTPAYASPEQVQGETVNTATDVYSLGVVLYELLTGHSPYRLKTHSSVDVLNAVVQQEPERPSTAVRRTGEPRSKHGGSPVVLTPELVSRTREGSPDRLRRCLRGDLDIILLKALRKEPERRYRSVDAFSEDLRRYREGRPVAARRGTLSYRARKFVRRHTLGVAAITLTLAAMVGGGLAATYGFVRARAAEREAVCEAAKATAINEFMQETLFQAHPSYGGGREITMVEALASAVPQIDAAFPDQPQVRAAVQNTIGRVYVDLGLFEEAETLLQRALTTRRAELGDEHLDVAECLHNLGAVSLEKGDYAAAESYQRQALDIRRRLRGESDLLVAESLNDLAITLQKGKADYDAAQRLLEQSLAIKRAQRGERHRDVAQALLNLGMVHYRRDDLDEAERCFREGLRLNRELLGSDHVEVASSLNNLALVLRDKGDYSGAAELLREALRIDRLRIGADHPGIGNGLNNLGATLVRAGRLEEAEGLFREALVIHRRAYPEGHFQIATTENLLGGCLTAMKRYAEAEPLLKGSYGIIAAKFGEEHPRTVAARTRLIELYEAWGRPEAAARYRTPGPS